MFLMRPRNVSHPERSRLSTGSRFSSDRAAIRRPDRTAFPPCSASANYLRHGPGHSFEPLCPGSAGPAAEPSPAQRRKTRPIPSAPVTASPLLAPRAFQVLPDVLSLVVRQIFKPAARRGIVVRAGVHHGVGRRSSQGDEGLSGVTVESELQDPHSRQDGIDRAAHTRRA